MNVKLVKLTRNYYDQLKDMLDEWKADILINKGNHSPYAIFKNDYSDFDYYLDNLDHNKDEGNKVKTSTFFLLDIDRNIFLGAINIRHHLNEGLLNGGGHIGDGIRPSERRKGYATRMISLALEECKKLGIYQVMMACDKDNIGSAKSIINNGGILEKEYINEEGILEQVYWIFLEDKDLINRLKDKDDKQAYAYVKTIVDESKLCNMHYKNFDLFKSLLFDDKSYIRTRGLLLCLAQAKWDVDNKINDSINDLLKLFHDDKPTVVRQSLKAFSEALVYKNELYDIVIKEAKSIDLSKYKDSMISLINKDINNLIVNK